LELVDHKPLVLAADMGGHRLVVGQETGRIEQHVLHVHPALLPLHLLVALHHTSHLVRSEARHAARARSCDAWVVERLNVGDLGPLHLASQIT
jgi:hypothetical protein